MGRSAWLKWDWAPKHPKFRSRLERRLYARTLRRDARRARLLTAKRGVPGLSQPTVAHVYRRHFAKLNDLHTAPATSRFRR